MESQPKNKRVDHCLKVLFPSLTSRQHEEALGAGLVRSVSGGTLKKGDKVGGENELQCDGLRAHLLGLAQGNSALRVLVIQEQDGFLVVDKPAGMPSHPLGLFDSNTVTQWALAKYPSLATEFPEAQPTLVPHRLDSGTSGLLIVAKTKAGFAEWREKFRTKRVRKKYLAWCWGKPPEDEFEVNYAIGHDAGDARKMSIPAKGEKTSKPILEAQSLVKVRKRVRSRGAFLAEVNCFSGVTHQVRVHLAAMGFPLLGDELYDAFAAERAMQFPFHQLRAIELATESDLYRVPEAEFGETVAEQK